MHQLSFSGKLYFFYVKMKNSIKLKSVPVPSCYQTAPSYRKMCNSSKAIKTSSRRPTKQCFYVLEPLHWYLHKVKKCARTSSLERANRAIKLKSVSVPSCSILLVSMRLARGQLLRSVHTEKATSARRLTGNPPLEVASG